MKDQPIIKPKNFKISNKTKLLPSLRKNNDFQNNTTRARQFPKSKFNTQKFSPQVTIRDVQ